MTLARLNNLLLLLIIALNAYIVLTPFMPAVIYKVQSHTDQRQQLEKKLTVSSKRPNQHHPNGLVIPSMLLDQPIYEGSIANQYKTLDKGIWRWPKGSAPNKGGNTILIGHRFTYTQPKGVFYFLDKVKINDQIGLWWQNKRYIYKVSAIREVLPSETSIQDNTDDARLTIFTCAPLWLPKHRLVVTAKLENT